MFFARIKAGHKNGYPRFKSKRLFNSISFIWNNGARIEENRLYLHSVSETIKVKWHRELPKDGKIKQLVIKRESSGKWYACFQIQFSEKYIVHHSNKEIGIDLGLNNFAAFSNDQIIKMPKYFRMMQNKLRKQQRKVSRRKKFSNRWRKACKQVAITHEHISNQRLDFHHKVAHEIANRFSFISIENLSLNGLHRTRLAKSFSDAGLGNFLLILASKVSETGGELIKVNPAYTSHTCPKCGQIKKKELSERWHKCDCGFECDRDVAAAQMILKLARTERSKRNVAVVTRKRALRSRRISVVE
jgi:putative transposase